MAKNKYRNSDDSFDVSNFNVKIVVIGYGCYGESSIVLLRDGDTVFYSLAIDSFHYLEGRNVLMPFINKTADVLKDYHVERLDVLCWTHPHDDHSKGFPRLICKYCDGESKVVFPMYLQRNSSDIVRYGVVSKCNLRFILEKNKKHESLATPIGVSDNADQNIDEFRLNDLYSSDTTARIRIDAITPISSRLTEFVNGSFCSDPNELSVSLVIDINGYGLYFGGDTKNNHIERAKRSLINHCRFVKIPHHASPTANKLTKFLPPELDAVCTTAFKWGGASLPDDNVIDNYRKFNADIYSTNKDLGNKFPFGIVEYDYDFSGGIPVVTPSCSGNGGII